MNPVLRIATILAATGYSRPPAMDRTYRPRDDGGVDIVTLEMPPEPRIDAAQAAAMLRDLETKPYLSLEEQIRAGSLRAQADYRATGRRSTRWPPRREGKDRSKEKAARKARKKNRGR